MVSVVIDEATENFYLESLRHLLESGVPFMVGGAFALGEYADIYRDTKDLDIFCTTGAYPRVLQVLSDAGYKTEITDATWLAKAKHGKRFVDVIFASANGIAPVDESWFSHARTGDLFGCEVKLIPPEELLWQKMMLLDRYRFDGADVNHIIRKQGPRLDWKRLLLRMEPYWEVLLAHTLLYRFVYPADREQVPRWLIDELLSRASSYANAPTPVEKICRGGLLSKTQYAVDIEQWNYRAK